MSQDRITQEQYEEATKYVTSNDDSAEMWINRSETEVNVYNDDDGKPPSPYVRLDGCLTLKMAESLVTIMKYKLQQST